MNFAAETKLDAETLEAYHRLSGKSVLRVKLTVIQVALLAGGPLAIAGAMYSLYAVGFAVLPMVSIGAGILMLMLGMNYYRYLTWKTSLRLGFDMEQQFFFEDDRLVARTKAEQVTHKYGAFKAIVESQDYFGLFLNKYFGYILPKKGFFQGDPAQLAAFLKEKSGKDVRVVKI